MAEEIREQDRFLPIANISRIMKKALPEGAKIAKDAKDTVQEAVSEFIAFVTQEGPCSSGAMRRLELEVVVVTLRGIGSERPVHG